MQLNLKNAQPIPPAPSRRQVLGWGPKVSLPEGLKETITYFKEKLEAV